MKRWITMWVAVICFQVPLMGLAGPGGSAAMEGKGTHALASLDILDLATAKRIAVAENPTLAAAEARVRQASQRVRQASAAYMPRVDATGSAKHIRLSDNERASQLVTARFLDPQASIGDSEDHYTAGLTATWVLFDGFARKFTREFEKFGEQQQLEARQEARRLILSAVADTFYNAQLARENMAIATADETFNLRQVTEAEARLRVGTGALSDVLNFKVQVNAARSRFSRFRLEYQQLLIGLAALMGVPDAGLPPNLALSQLTTENETEMTMPDTDAQVVEALAHRPDLLQRDFRIQQTDAQIQVARSEFFPKLDLLADLAGNRDNSPAFEEDDFGYTLGFNFTYNLYAGGATRARIREAVWSRAEAEQDYADLSITVASEVRQAVADLDRAQTELKLQRANTTLVEKNRDLVEREYAAGQGTLVRLNEAQRDLITAQSRLALALVSLRKAWQNLETATGRIVASVPGTSP